ncbi:MAG TPA: GntR family transcriptional regulator, partial [Reyranella sp.]|nr:GntR family transcriptional regulator [Reyranella sp.]
LILGKAVLLQERRGGLAVDARHLALESDQEARQRLDERLAPGERLVEDKLSAELGVSRVPVREALLALSAQGLVRIEPRRGATVAEITPRIVAELVEVRALLEGLNARLAAQRHDPEIVAQLTDTLARGNAAAKAGTRAELARLNAEFHDRLAEASRNSVLSDVMRGLRERTSLAFAINGRARAREDWQEHAGVLAAVIAGDSELDALLANRHVHNAAASFAAATEGKDQAA